MSRYTTELRFYIEMNSTQGQTVSQRIQEARKKVFDFPYPIWNEEYKAVLEEKIIKHYYFYEIGFETIGQFKLFLDAKMNEIMPKYNRLYSDIQIFNNLLATDNEQEQEQDQENIENEGSNNTVNSTESRHIESNTPQSKLSDVDYASFISEDNANGNSDTQSASSQSRTLSRTRTRTRTSGDIVELINKYHDEYNDIDVLIINELKPLFFESVLLY